MERIILNFKNFLLLEQSKDANLYSYDKLFESGTGADYVMPDVKTWINLRLDGRISSDKKINYKDKLIWNSQKDKYKSKLIDDVVSIYGGSDLSKQDIWFEIMKYGAAIGAGIGILFFVNKGLKRFESYKNFIRAVKGMFKKNIDGIDQKDLVILKNEIFSDAQLSKYSALEADSRPGLKAEAELKSLGIPNSNILVLEETIEKQISKIEKDMFGNNEYLTKSNDVILRFTDNELKKNAKVDALNNQDVYKCYSLTDDFIKKITKDDRGNYYYENVQVKLDKKGTLYHPKILKASNGSTISNYSGFITFLKTIKDTKKMETDALEGLSNEGIEITGIGQREKNIKTILKTLGFASPFVGELVLVIANIDKIKAKIFPEYVSNMHGETFISVLKAKLENTDGFEKFKDDIVSNNREDTKDKDGNVTSVRYPEELPYKVSYHLAYLVGEYYGKVVPSVALVTIKNNPSIS